MKKRKRLLLGVKILICVAVVIYLYRGRLDFDIVKMHDNSYGVFFIDERRLTYYYQQKLDVDDRCYRHEIDTLRGHMHTLNNMRKIWQAKLQYEQEHEGTLPIFTQDSQGNKLHSWRTLLLPYLGEEEFYERMDLDQPWNSDVNLRARTNYLISEDDLKASPDETIPEGPTKIRPNIFEGGASPNQYIEINALLLPDGKKDFILIESSNDPLIEDQYDVDREYTDPERDITLEQIRDGSFLKIMRFMPIHPDRRFLICCEQGEFLISIDISPKELERFILEKCCKN